MHDVRYAFRALRHSPWYASTVVVVLAAGIALATVVFAVVDGVLFKPLPLSRPAELFVIRADVTSEPRARMRPVSFREIKTWMNAAPELAFSGMSAAPSPYATEPGRELYTAQVDERFFDVVGQRPLLGGFRPEDFEWNFGRVEDDGIWQPQIIGYRLWQQDYGGDPAIVGRTFVTSERNGQTRGRRIVGVLPRGFVFPIDAGGAQPDMLTPLFLGLQRTAERRFTAIVRIPGAIDVPQIEERLRVATRLALSTPVPPGRHDPGAAVSFDDVRLTAVPEHLGSDERPAFRVVTMAAGLMLLLACLNVAGLSAARNIERRRDLAVRRALGASGWQISRVLIAEIAILALAGTAAAFALAKPMLLATLSLLPSTVTLMKIPAIDGRVFAVMALFSAGTVLIVSLWPARVAARVRPPSAMHALGGTWTTMGRRSRFLLVGAQVGLGFVLLTAGGLSLASFAAAWRTDAGFNRDRMILFEAFVTRSASQEDSTRQLVAGQATLAGLPGVEEVAVSSIQPLFARRMIAWSQLGPQGGTAPLEGVAVREVTGNYFRMMGLDLLGGRWPSAGEWTSSRHVGIVSATAARRLWPDRDAVGQVLVPQSARRRAAPPILVIGVVADARYGALDADPLADIYLPEPIGRGTYGAYLHARTSGPPDRVLSNAVVALQTAGLRLEQATTHQDAMFAALKHRALPAWLFGTLGLAALLVLGAGILGILAMSAAQRTREIGIRVALGASSGAVVRLFVREQLAPVAAGLAAGGAISAWAARYVQSQLYSISAYEPAVWSVIAVTIVAVATAGTLTPAVRAARVNPVQALRAE